MYLGKYKLCLAALPSGRSSITNEWNVKSDWFKKDISSDGNQSQFQD